MRTVWVVEDDYLQRDAICKAIKEKFNVNIIELSTEYEFRDKLEKLTKPYPELIVLDEMLPWTKAVRKMPEAPAEVIENGFYRAGMRCEKLARDKQEIKKVPIIIYTMLEQVDIEEDLKNISENTVYLGKSCDINELLNQIQNKELY